MANEKNEQTERNERNDQTEKFLNYYANLLIMQYRGSEQNKDFVKALVNTAYMNGAYDIFKKFFDLEKAAGAHLEILGLYVGAYRMYNQYRLTDEQLKMLIKMLSAKNGLGATCAEISELLYSAFGDDVLLFNNYDMSISYFVSQEWGDFFENVLLAGGYLPVPQGVGVKLVIKVPYTKVFGYADAYDGLNTNVIVGYNDCWEQYHTDWTYLDSSMIKTYQASIS